MVLLPAAGIVESELQSVVFKLCCTTKSLVFCSEAVDQRKTDLPFCLSADMLSQVTGREPEVPDIVKFLVDEQVSPPEVTVYVTVPVPAAEAVKRPELELITAIPAGEAVKDQVPPEVLGP